MTSRWLVIALCASSTVSRADKLEPDDLITPAPEVRRPDVKVDLPAVPAFDLPAPNADGSHSIKELRVDGTSLLGRDIVVRGVITWVYDCPTAIRAAGEKDKQVAKRIEDDPTLCERAKFYVGDTAQTPVEQSLWIVDVPRPFNKQELVNSSKDELKNPPPNRCDPRAPKTCPVYKVGDEVTIAGTFAQASPHSERNSDGLLVYKNMKNVTQSWESAGGVDKPSGLAHPRSPGLAGPPSKPAPPPPAVKPMRKVVDPQVRAESTRHANEGGKAMGQKQFAQAIAEYKAAVAWDGNHLAWYGLGASFAMTVAWSDAADAFTHAVALRRDIPMYQLWLGIALYEKAVQQARTDQAMKQNLKPEEVRPDLTAINFDLVRSHLDEAVRLNPDLWRAHYYLGRIAREQSRAKDAATELTRAIAGNPRESGPYVALAELYLKWDYVDEAIKIATQGTTNVPGSSEVSDIWYELGMGYDAKGRSQEAIDAFSKAIEARRDQLKAKYMRGQAYFKIKDYANAKRDLEEFIKAGGSRFAAQQAAKMLMDIAAIAAVKH